MIRKKLSFIALIIAIMYVFSIPASALEIGGIDLRSPLNSVVSYGGNVWHTNFSAGTAVFPFQEVWDPVQVGYTEGQPIIIDDYIFVQAEGKITAVLKETGKALGTYSLSSSTPLQASLFAVKNSDGEYQLLAVDSNTIRSIIASAGNGGISFRQSWEYVAGTSIIMANSVTVFEDGNSGIKKKYTAFSTNAGNLVTLLLDNGSEVTNGNIKTGGTLDSFAPIPYYNYDNLLSKIAIPGNISGNGFVAGSYMSNGVQQEDLVLGKDMKWNVNVGRLKGPSAMTYVADTRRGGTRPVSIVDENDGIVLGYDPDQGEMLFRINKFSGGKVVGLTIKGTSIIATINKGSKGYIMGFDLMRAIEAAEDNEERGRIADDCVSFSNELNGISTSGSTAFAVMDTDMDDYGNTRHSTYREVLVSGDQSNDSGKANLVMHYLDRIDSANKRAVDVPYAFMKNNVTASGYYIPGGVASRLSCAAGYLVLVDGNGYLHGFTAQKADNLAVANFDNSKNVLEKCGSYTAAVDIVNFSGKSYDNIPINFTLYDDKDTLVHTHSEKISFGPDGCTVYLKYTIPAEFSSKSLTLKAELNMESRKAVQETTYDDNTVIMKMDVKDDINLSVVGLKYDRYPANQRVTAVVLIKNSSDVTLGEPMVPVKFTINWNGQVSEKVKEVVVPKSSMGVTQVTFSFTTPNADTTFNMTAEVNPLGTYKETDLSDNRKTIMVTVSKNGTYTAPSGGNKNSWGDTTVVRYEDQTITEVQKVP